jgi:cytochrome c oxidase subunit 4
MAAENNSTHHVIPARVFGIILGALLVLTVLTVMFHNMHLGSLAAPVAFIIATTKAVLVMSYFMHMKYESMINRVIFGTAFFFVGLLFLICVIDVFTRIAVQSTL